MSVSDLINFFPDMGTGTSCKVLGMVRQFVTTNVALWTLVVSYYLYSTIMSQRCVSSIWDDSLVLWTRVVPDAHPCPAFVQITAVVGMEGALRGVTRLCYHSGGADDSPHVRVGGFLVLD